jgi:hypothetical protein
VFPTPPPPFSFPPTASQLAATVSRENIVEALRELSNEEDAILALDPRGEKFKFTGAGARRGGRGGGGGGGGYGGLGAEFGIEAL